MTSDSSTRHIWLHIEFCIQPWSPNFVKDIEVLERVQKTATNLVPQLKKCSYPARLKKIGITSLKDRRLRGDMIEVYKLLTGKEHINYKQFFRLAENHYGVRGHEKTGEDWLFVPWTIFLQWPVTVIPQVFCKLHVRT